MNQNKNLSIYERIQKKIKNNIPSQSSIDTQAIQQNTIIENQQTRIQKLQELKYNQNKKIQELTDLLRKQSYVANKGIICDQKDSTKERKKAPKSDSLSDDSSCDSDGQRSQSHSKNQMLQEDSEEIEERQMASLRRKKLKNNAISAEDINDSASLDLSKRSQQNMQDQIPQPLPMMSNCDSKQATQTNPALFKRIQDLLEKQNENKTKQLKDAQAYRNNLKNQEIINQGKLLKKSDFYCNVCQISFKTINNLQSHNTQFHIDQQYQKDNDEILFTCKVCEVESFHSKVGCQKHEEKCLERYVLMINSQEGKQMLSFKEFSLEEQDLLNLAQKCLKKKY